MLLTTAAPSLIEGLGLASATIISTSVKVKIHPFRFFMSAPYHLRYLLALFETDASGAINNLS
jgi:hypothetical protein